MNSSGQNHHIRDELSQFIAYVDDIVTHPRNPRRGDLDAITTSLEAHGQYKPIAVQKSSGHILLGNHTYLAACRLGWTQIAAIYLDVDDDQALRILLADNRTSDVGDYDNDELSQLLKELAGTSEHLAGTGYSDDDLSDLLAQLESGDGGSRASHLDDTDDTARTPLDDVPSICQTGDLWQLGEHRVICADCRDVDALGRLLAGRTADLIFTSPPYASQRTYDKESGFRPVRPDDYPSWFADVADVLAGVLADEGSMLVNIKEHCEGGQRHLYVYDTISYLVRQHDWLWVDELIWLDKSNGMPGTWPNRFKDAWERLYHLARNDKIKFFPYQNAHESSRVFEYHAATVKGMDSDRGYVKPDMVPQEHSGMALPSNVIAIAAGGETGVGHPAMFPIDLPAWFINAYSAPGDVILDPFAGAGTTLMAAHDKNRRGMAVEISPRYVDLICRRWHKTTGITPIRESDGQAVSFLG